MKKGTYIFCNLSDNNFGDNKIYVNSDFGKRLRYVGGIEKEMGNLS